MPGRRPLTSAEERQLLRVVRSLRARDRALITTQWMTGFRISEVLSLRVKDILRNGEIVDKIGIAPRNLKGGYGRTRWVPVLPELNRALARHLGSLRQRYELSGDLPLFLSRQNNPNGSARPLSRESARTILHEAFRQAGVADDGRLGTHTLRKTWAQSVYEAAGHDIVLLRSALNHSDVSVTQAYLEVNAGRLDEAMRRCDFTRGPRSPKVKRLPAQRAVAAIGQAA